MKENEFCHNPEERNTLLSLQIYSKRESRLIDVLVGRLQSAACFKRVERVNNLGDLSDSPMTILLLMDCNSFATISAASKVCRKKGKRIGILLGDISQYLQDIYKYYLRYVDFVLCEDPGEAALIEFGYGVPSFYHPFIQPKSLLTPFRSSVCGVDVKRQFEFVHLGLIDEFRLGRMGLRNTLKKLGASYVLYGSGHNECVRLPWDQVHTRLERCTFGLVACAASTSDPLSRPGREARYQLKGKIWEYMLAGCIPVVDYLPGALSVGLKNGIDYLQLGSFNEETLGRLLEMKVSRKIEMSMHVREKANEIVFCSNGVLQFRDFLVGILNIDSANSLLPSYTRLSKACERYTFDQQHFSGEVLLSSFYLIKVVNYFRRTLRRVRLKLMLSELVEVRRCIFKRPRPMDH